MKLKTRNKASAIKLFTAFLLLVSLLAYTTHAWATFISPKRVIIERNINTGGLFINNNSDKVVIYRFDWESRAQSPDGESLLLKDGETTPGYKPVHDMIRFSPRQIILKPGKSQKIRFLIRRPADLAVGEYHSHLLIKAMPKKPDAPKVAQVPTGDSGANIEGSISVRTYASIPVFLRHGETKLDIKLTEATLYKKEGRDYLKASVVNNSTRSAYLRSELECYDSSGEMRKAIVQTFKVYVEAKRKEQDILVPATFSTDGCVSFRFTLTGKDDFEYRRKLIDAIDVVVLR